MPVRRFRLACFAILAAAGKADNHDQHFAPMLDHWREAMNAVLAARPAPAESRRPR